MDPTPGNLESSSKTLLITPASEVVADIITTAALYAGLRKRKTGWERTDQLLRRVMVMTIETQLPPLIVWVLSPPSASTAGNKGRGEAAMMMKEAERRKTR